MNLTITRCLNNSGLTPTEEDLRIHRRPAVLEDRRADLRSFPFDHLYPTIRLVPVNQDSTGQHRRHTMPYFSHLIRVSVSYQLMLTGDLASLLGFDLDPIRSPRVGRISAIQLLHYQPFTPLISFTTNNFRAPKAYLVSKIRSNIARISFPLFPLFSSANSSRP
jgi:hypothetical protein